MEKILNRIKYTRKRLGINQSELAELVGISPAMMSNYEAGNTRLPSDIIPGICRELKITPNELFGWKEEIYSKSDILNLIQSLKEQ